MYQKMNQIYEQYGLTVNRSYKGRGALILETNNGLLNIKEYEGSERKLELMEEVLLYLKEQDEFCVDAIIRTTDGNCMTKDMYDNHYYLREWYGGRECDPESREDTLAAVEALAYLHRAMAKFSGNVPEQTVKSTEEIFQELGRHNRELKKVRNYIRAKKQRNEFEEGFLSYYGQLEESMKKIEGEAALLPPTDKMFCHGEYTYHNVLFMESKISIVNFEQFRWDSRMSDLATFLRKVMEKNNWNIGLGMELLDRYDKTSEISQQEWRELYIRMAYPMKFWKIANHYMNARKSWPCQRDYDKMESFMKQQEPREQFLIFLQHSCDPLYFSV